MIDACRITSIAPTGAAAPGRRALPPGWSLSGDEARAADALRTALQNGLLPSPAENASAPAAAIAPVMGDWQNLMQQAAAG